jgi:ABC-type transporter Mla subunit MlaD
MKIQEVTTQALQGLQTVGNDLSTILPEIQDTLKKANEVYQIGTATIPVLDSYLDMLDSGVDDADELLKDTNKIGASTKSLLSTSQEVIDSITALNGVLNQYKDDTVDALKSTEKLADGISQGLSDSQAFLTSLQVMLRTSGNSLDEGTRQSLAGLIDVLQKALDQTKNTTTMKNANNSIQKAIDDKIDKFEDENNLLNLDAEAKPVSFTSSKNASPESIQIIMRTEEISTEDNSQKIKDQEQAEAYVSPLARIQNLFAKIWQAIVSAFSS